MRAKRPTTEMVRDCGLRSGGNNRIPRRAPALKELKLNKGTHIFGGKRLSLLHDEAVLDGRMNKSFTHKTQDILYVPLYLKDITHLLFCLCNTALVPRQLAYLHSCPLLTQPLDNCNRR